MLSLEGMRCIIYNIYIYTLKQSFGAFDALQDLIGSEFHLEHIDEVQSRDAIKWFSVASELFCSHVQNHIPRHSKK